GSAPVFVATQVSVWGYHNIGDVINLEKYLSDYYEDIYGKDVVEFVRADHFYNLYYQANNLPQDITLKSELTATATSADDKAMLTSDGTCYGDSIWTAEQAGRQSITYSLSKTYDVSEVAVYHAETNGLDASLNTRGFTVEVSTDNENWKKVAEVSGNTASWSDVQFKAAKASYVRITVEDAGSDSIARIADVDIYGVLNK
ncbi:MAG: discoidin domain-containing protein, partial [Clostridia bacterium]|nr:discoidin domain-containing protein [Clostridia bacterium]